MQHACDDDGRDWQFTHLLHKPYSSDLVLADGSPAPPALLYTAMNDADAEVRVRAALGLVQAGDLNAPIVDLLFAAADWRRDPEAADRARYSIVALGAADPQLLAPLYAALDDPAEMVRTSAAASLKRLGL